MVGGHLFALKTILKSCRNNKKRENLEYYFITCNFPKLKLKSGFRISCSVRRKLFEESTTTALTPSLLGILTFLCFLKSGGGGGGEFIWCNSHVTAYKSVLKFLQVGVKSITNFKMYKSVLFFKYCHSVDSIDSISVDTEPTEPIRSV